MRRFEPFGIAFARARGAAHESPIGFGLTQRLLRLLARLPTGPTGVLRAAPPRDGSPVVALSFDDGPSPANTQRLLAMLRSADARATFFMVGARAQANASLARAVVEAGHEVGNHSLDHVHPSRLSRAELEQNFAAAARAIEASAGVAPVLLRPPFGKSARTLTSIARRRGDRVVLWAVDSGDTAGFDADRVAEEVIARVRSGDIVLLHDGGEERPVTLAATGTILATLSARGFRFVTVSELLAASEPRSAP